MEFHIDTADIEEVRAANQLGILDGVTTNPSLVAKTGKPHKEVIAEICKEAMIVLGGKTTHHLCDIKLQERIKLGIG